MDPTHKKLLKRNHVQIVGDLEPKDVTDKLLEDGILTDNDCDKVSNPTINRKERCQILMSMLTKRGPFAYDSFKEALRYSKYNHIEKLITADNKNIDRLCSYGSTPKNIGDSGDFCENCRPYFPQKFVDSNLEYLLKQNCCLILQNVEAKDLLPFSYQEEILSENECERVTCSVTRKDRLAVYIRELSRVAKKDLVDLFKKSLQSKYQYIHDVISKSDCVKSVVQSQRPDVCDRQLQRNVIPEHSTSKNVVDSQTPSSASAKGTNMNSMLNTEKDTICVLQSPQKNSMCISCNISSSSDEQHDFSFRAVMNTQCKIQKRKRIMPSVIDLSNSSSGEDNSYTRSKRQCRYQQRLKQTKEMHSPETHSALVVSPGSSCPDCLPTKHLEITFNTLITMMNRGHFDMFDRLTSQLHHRFQINPDMKCILKYLQANLELHRSNFDGAKDNINSGLSLCGETGNSRYFTLELLGTKARMLLYQRKHEKVQEVVDDAKMIIETDPVGCSGRAAAWLHVQEARKIASQIDMLNVRRTNFHSVHNFLEKKARKSFEQALENFRVDKSEYGPVGFVYTMCRLVILLLRCGENGLTMNVTQAEEDDIEKSASYLFQVNESDVTSRKVLNMHYHIAKSDYHFRKFNMGKALECAQIAHKMATELNMREFANHAHNRVVFLKKGHTLPLNDQNSCDFDILIRNILSNENVE